MNENSFIDLLTQTDSPIETPMLPNQGRSPSMIGWQPKELIPKESVGMPTRMPDQGRDLTGTIVSHKKEDGIKFEKTPTKDVSVKLDYLPTFDNYIKELELNEKIEEDDRNETILQLIEKRNKILKNAKHQVDLRPLAQLIDAQTGSKFAENWASPKGTEKLINMASDIDKTILAYKQKGFESKRNAEEQKIKMAIEEEKIKRDRELKLAMLALQYEKFSGEEGKPKVKLSDKTRELMIDKALGYKAMAELRDMIVEDPEISKLMGIHRKYLAVPGGELIWKKSEERRVLQSAIDAHIQRQGKLMEGGVLRKDDWLKYRIIFGTVDSQPEVFLRNHMRFMNQFRDEYNIRLDTWKKTGIETSAFPELKDMDKKDVKNFIKNTSKSATKTTQGPPVMDKTTILSGKIKSEIDKRKK